MKYSKTGNFTPNQIKLAKEISDKLKKLKKSGCIILAKQNSLSAYKNTDMRHSVPLHLDYTGDRKHPIKSLDLGDIDDAGGDDEELFEKGYITEE